MVRNGVWAVAVVACGIGLVVAQVPQVVPVPAPVDPKPTPIAPKADAKPPEIGWEVRTADGSFHKITPVETELSLETKYGTVKVPMKEVKRVDFGLRMTDAQRKKLADALADVIGSSGRPREAGKEALVDLGLLAFPEVARALKTAPKEALPHLTLVHDKLKRLIGPDDDDPLDQDVVFTADGSRLCGKMTPEAIRVKFGETEKALKWTDARTLAYGDIVVDAKVEVVTLGQFGIHGLMQTHFEKVVGVEVTGVAQGSVWGVNPYTTDSTIGMAAVHAGVLKAGETGVIKIKVKADLGAYAGSTQNGVTTGNWGPYQGCYEIISKSKKRGK